MQLCFIAFIAMAMEDFLPHLTHMTGRQRRTSAHFYDTGELPPQISTKDSLAENDDDVPLENSVALEVPGRASKDHQGSPRITRINKSLLQISD